MPTSALSAPDAQRARELVRTVQERKQGLEDRIDWYRTRYMGIGVRNLTELSPDEVMAFRDIVSRENGKVYVMVHPAYYLYFQQRSLSIPYRAGDPVYNLVDWYLLMPHSKDPVEELMREQVRIEKEFLQYAAAENHVVIFVVPGKYRRHPNYRFHEDGLDEYARYLNEVSALTDSFLYLESTSATRGFVDDRTLEKLVAFLDQVGVRAVFVGGGFIGRCQEDFYRDVTEKVKDSTVAVVAELSAVSPRDVNDWQALGLLGGTGRLRSRVAIQNIRRNSYNRLERRPRVVSLFQTDPIIGALVLNRGLFTAEQSVAFTVPSL